MKFKYIIPVCLMSLFLGGCQTGSVPVAQNQNDALTLGTFQRSIHKGMTQSEVIEVLGSPNLVTRDKDGIETWAYDKASTVATIQKNQIYGTVLLIGGSSTSAQASSTQRTLTLILKFKDGVVSEYTYRSTSF